MNNESSKGNALLNICTIATAVVAVVGFIGSMWYSRQSLEYTALSFKELQEERALDEKRFATDQQNRQQDRLEHEKDSRGSRAPFLAVARCCNQVPIKFLDDAATAHGEAIGLDSDAQSSFLKYPNYNQGFIGEINNLGAGAATDVKVIWHPETIQYVSGEKRSLAIKDSGDDSFNRPYAWPNYIPSTGNAAIKNIPRCISEIRERTIALVSGVLEISCRNIAGENYIFWQNFTIEPVFTADADGGPPRLSAHFLEIRDDLTSRPYSTAKPVTP